MKYLLIIFSLVLVGCGSTPYRDDYAKHVNLITNNNANFIFDFSEELVVDLRGQYSKNDTATASPILYQGAAGIAGMLIQIGAHSSLINSQRNEKLAAEQKQANQSIASLISLTENISLNNLIQEHSFHQQSLENNDAVIVRMKPIFFSNKEMTKLSLKSIVWIPVDDKNKKRKQKYKYKNMIHIYGDELNESQQQKLLDGDATFLSLQLSNLINTAINIAKNDLTGGYPVKTNRNKTFFINDGVEKKVVRGSIIAKQCGYQIIQNLHSWFIAFPLPKTQPNIKNSMSHQC
jgi:hypothetical protein